MAKILVIQHSPLEGSGLFEEEIKLAGHTYETLMVSDKAVWPSGAQLENFAGLIILGGPMGVYEEAKYPWISKELMVLTEALRQKKPMLGICLGSQMIAKAAGAKVYPGTKKEIGWGIIRLDDWFYKRNPLMYQLDPQKEYPVFQWHGDTFDIPYDGYRLAWNDNYPNQAFCVNGNAIGLQFHPEVTLDMVKSWCTSEEGQEDANRGGYDAKKVLSLCKPESFEALKELAHKLFYGFSSLLRDNIRRAA